jgi:hypothetical protein
MVDEGREGSEGGRGQAKDKVRWYKLCAGVPDKVVASRCRCTLEPFPSRSSPPYRKPSGAAALRRCGAAALPVLACRRGTAHWIGWPIPLAALTPLSSSSTHSLRRSTNACPQSCELTARYPLYTFHHSNSTAIALNTPNPDPAGATSPTSAPVVSENPRSRLCWDWGFAARKDGCLKVRNWLTHAGDVQMISLSNNFNEKTLPRTHFVCIISIRLCPLHCLCLCLLRSIKRLSAA